MNPAASNNIVNIFFLLIVEEYFEFHKCQVHYTGSN